MIITPKLSSVIGENIQGPSVIKSPSWLHNKLGKYLLYFADHKGDNIKLAYSDDLFGPWKIYEKGTLKLSESLFLNEKPKLNQVKTYLCAFEKDRKFVLDNGKLEEKLS